MHALPVAPRLGVLAARAARRRRPLLPAATLHISARLRRDPPSQHSSASPPDASSQAASTTSLVARALQDGSANAQLLAPVHIADDPQAILRAAHPAASLLAHSSLVIAREMNSMNVLVGYEEANQYVVLDAQGQHVGYMAEQEDGAGRAITRQLLRTHRRFTTHVFDRARQPILRFERPFSAIRSTISVYDVEGGDHRRIGEAQQVWAPLRRKYDLFVARPAPAEEEEDASATPVLAQFARVDAPWLSWDFVMQGADGTPRAAVTRSFTNLGRELFTDAGVYALRMDAAAASEEAKDRGLVTVPSTRGTTLDERAVMLATAVTIDYDYFSRERGGMFGGMPLWLPWGGGAGEAGAAGAGAAGAGAGAAGDAGAAAAAGAGAGAEVAGTAAGSVARGAATTVGESAMTGAGTMAAYEAMQRAREGWETSDQGAAGQSPTDANAPGADERPWWELDQQAQEGQDAQQQEQDPWWGGEQGGGDGGGGDGGDGGGDWGDLF